MSSEKNERWIDLPPPFKTIVFFRQALLSFSQSRCLIESGRSKMLARHMVYRTISLCSRLDLYWYGVGSYRTAYTYLGYTRRAKSRPTNEWLCYNLPRDGSYRNLLNYSDPCCSARLKPKHPVVSCSFVKRFSTDFQSYQLSADNRRPLDRCLFWLTL